MMYVYGIMHVVGEKQYRGSTLFSTWDLAEAFCAQLQKDDENIGLLGGKWIPTRIQVHEK